MSTWYKVSTSGQLHGRLELPDEFEQYIRRIEAERDEARKSAQEWGDLWRKMNDLRVRATMERNEARRWAAHFYRLWKAFDTPANEKPFTVKVTGLNHIQQAIEDAKPAINEAMRGAVNRAMGGDSITRQSKRSKVSK